jgi:hypothetical protein
MKTSAIPPLLRVSTKKKRSEFKQYINTTEHKRERERERERERRDVVIKRERKREKKTHKKTI